AALFGPEAAAALLPIDEGRGMLRLSGFVASPAVTRATAAAQALTVNGRPVSDPVLRTAVRVAYREVIAAGRHPVAALWLDLPADELDVNVHPAKAELRFRDAAAVRGLVIGAIGRALAGAAGVQVPAHRPVLGLLPPRRSTSALPAGALRAIPLPGMAEAQLGLAMPPAARVAEAPPRPAEDHPLGAPLGQVQDTYIVAVAADGSLILVDQHAAHERLTHEALRDQMLADGVRSQPLLVPAVVDLAATDAARVLARADDLAALGLDIEAFGPGAVLVRALPAALGTPDPGPLIRDLVDELAELDETTALASRLDAVIARMACHGSIRAGRRLSPTEMDALLRRMEATPRAATCSHGRPTVLRFTPPELAALFRRS
ncbi:MAG: DNA mismatch repair endonuclease MutL, partial [Acetobacteraceae bacterium]